MTTFNEYQVELAQAFSARFVAQASKAMLENPLSDSGENPLSVSPENAKQILASCNSSMFATLSALEKSASHEVIAKIMFTSKVAANRIMRQERSGALYNVYAYEKDVRIARTLASVASLEHYTKAVLLTTQAFTANDMLATHVDYEAAITKTKTGNKERDALIAFFELAKGSSTARTQVSSSVNALQSFNVITETRDASNRVAYKLNSEHKNTIKLLAALAR